MILVIIVKDARVPEMAVSRLPAPLLLLAPALLDRNTRRLPAGRRSATLPGMARRSKLAAVAVGVAIVVVAAAAVQLRQGLRCAGFAGPGVTSAELPGRAPAGHLRIATWNLRNFPLDERPQDPELGFARQTNICDLEDALAGLDADILGLAEIRDARRFPPILRRAGGEHGYQLVLSRHGGRRGQRLAIAWDDRALEAIGPPFEIREVAVDDDLRPALAQRLRSRREPGSALTVLQLHLKSTPRGYQVRMTQHRAVVEWVRRWVEGAAGQALVVMGDANSTGAEGGSTELELAAVDRLYEAVGLRRLANATGCTEYWEGGGEPDGVQQPSLLDHIWVRGLGGELPQARSWLHCARESCGPLVSRPGEEDATFWDVSDHCPVTADLRWPAGG
jgi:endonuclease/exonuclease/phosphatase family metal-dependent hydrolase